MGEKSAGMLTMREVAYMLHIHHNTVRRWCDRGVLKAQRVGPRGDRRFRPEDIDRFLASGGKSYPQQTVLIIEDDPEILKFLKDIAEKQGYTVSACATSDKALKEIERQHFDLILFDLSLPKQSGLEVLRAARTREQKVAVAVIAGYFGDFADLGPLFFIRNPLDADSIIEVLNETVGKKR
jgi:excisionase family DNA binding protein